MNIQYLLIVLAGEVAGLQQKRMADYFNASGPEVLREVTSTQGRWQAMTAAYKVIKDYENKANGSTGGESWWTLDKKDKSRFKQKNQVLLLLFSWPDRKINLSRLLYDELDPVLGTKDNITPRILMNSIDSDFTELFPDPDADDDIDPSLRSINTPRRQLPNSSEESPDPMTKPKRNGRKRKERSDDLAINEVKDMMEKRWKAEQEVFKEQIAREDMRLDKQDKRDEEMLGFMRIIAESVQKMAN